MTDRKPLSDPTETPEDVATLYSWANLHGAKYRDFSASRAQTREKAKLRVEEALEEEQRRARELAEAKEAAEAQRTAEVRRILEAAHQAELAAQEAAREMEKQAQQAAERAAQLAAQQAADQAAKNAAEQAALLAAQEAADQAAMRAAEHAAQTAAEQAAHRAAERAAYRAAEQAAAQHPAEQPSWQPREYAPPAVPSSNPVPASHYPPQPIYEYPGLPPQPAPFRPVPVPVEAPPPQHAAPREEPYQQPRAPWTPPETREPSGRPAWLMNDRPEAPGQPLGASVPQTPEDTLQGSRDRMTSRWFALRSAFDPNPIVPEAIPAPQVSRPPVMAVFSLAGGVGKTSLVATLGRALSSRGERVLLVDTAAFGLLPFFFGARDQRPGLLRTFSPPGVSSDAPIQMITLDPESLGPESPGQELLSTEIAKYARGASRIIVDLATASGATTRRILRMQPMILVPVIPDMNSVVSVSSIDAFFQHNGNPPGKAGLPHYVLNQFDPSLPLNLDVREVLREQLGDRLLPFALRRAPAMSEALAEGMTVMDYAPASTLAEDFGTLANWVKSLSAAANTTYRGVRWSER